MIQQKTKDVISNAMQKFVVITSLSVDENKMNFPMKLNYGWESFREMIWWHYGSILGFLLLTGFNLIPLWVCNYMHHKVWHETYLSITKFQRLHCWSLGIDK